MPSLFYGSVLNKSLPNKSLKISTLNDLLKAGFHLF